ARPLRQAPKEIATIESALRMVSLRSMVRYGIQLTRGIPAHKWKSKHRGSSRASWGRCSNANRADRRKHVCDTEPNRRSAPGRALEAVPGARALPVTRVQTIRLVPGDEPRGTSRRGPHREESASLAQGPV